MCVYVVKRETRLYFLVSSSPPPPIFDHEIDTMATPLPGQCMVHLGIMERDTHTSNPRSAPLAFSVLWSESASDARR